MKLQRKKSLRSSWLRSKKDQGCPNLNTKVKLNYLHSRHLMFAISAARVTTLITLSHIQMVSSVRLIIQRHPLSKTTCYKGDLLGLISYHRRGSTPRHSSIGTIRPPLWLSSRLSMCTLSTITSTSIRSTRPHRPGRGQQANHSPIRWSSLKLLITLSSRGCRRRQGWAAPTWEVCDLWPPGSIQSLLIIQGDRCTVATQLEQQQVICKRREHSQGPSRK